METGYAFVLEPDLALVLGLIIAAFSVPSIISALGDGRSPRAAMITVLIAGGLIIYALVTQPGGYTFADIPHAFVRVVAQILR